MKTKKQKTGKAVGEEEESEKGKRRAACESGLEPINGSVKSLIT